MFDSELSPKKVRLLNVTKSEGCLPSRKSRESLEVGMWVELAVECPTGRILVEVIGVGAKKYEGFVRSVPNPAEMQNVVKWGDLVEFRPCNVVAIRGEDGNTE